MRPQTAIGGLWELLSGGLELQWRPGVHQMPQQAQRTTALQWSLPWVTLLGGGVGWAKDLSNPDHQGIGLDQDLPAIF